TTYAAPEFERDAWRRTVWQDVEAQEGEYATADHEVVSVGKPRSGGGTGGRIRSDGEPDPQPKCGNWTDKLGSHWHRCHTSTHNGECEIRHVQRSCDKHGIVVAGCHCEYRASNRVSRDCVHGVSVCKRHRWAFHENPCPRGKWRKLLVRLLHDDW